MTMKPIVIGILPQDKIRERVLAIARGEHKPKPGEPKIWFTSMKSLAEVLSDDNRALIRVIAVTRHLDSEGVCIHTAVTQRV